VHHDHRGPQLSITTTFNAIVGLHYTEFKILSPKQYSCIRSASILSALRDNPGGYHKKIRRGRGPASGKGKTSGRGHKGQGQHGTGPPAGFTGGQTKDEVARGPRGFENIHSKEMVSVDLDRLQSWVDQGRINASRPITLLELRRSGCICSVKDGVKVLARGKEHLKTPLHLIVSRASSSAISAIEKAGGTITTRYYTKFAIKNILAEKTHPVHSRLFKPTPISELATDPQKQFQYDLPDPVQRKALEYYRDIANRGYLSYQVPRGQSPSLYFKTPGIGVSRKSQKIVEGAVESQQLW